MQDSSLLIDGKALWATGGATFERRNPISDQVVTRAAAAAVADVQAAAKAAAAAFPEWSGRGPNARRKQLLNAAECIEARTGRFVTAMQGEIGATEGWARFNVALAAGMLREAAALTTQITGETIASDKPGCVAMTIRQPAGVCLGIAPWNAPVILAVRALAMPLACGNTVILKSSEACPFTHYLVGEAFVEAGFPAGAVNVISNAPDAAAEIVNALIDDPAIRRINFTGSTRTGRLIAERAARHLKPVLLELGGKAPVVVLKDADLDEAVAAAAFGAFMNQGQICMSTERIIVEAPVAEAFVQAFAAKARTLRADDPAAGKAPLGALVSENSTAHVRDLIDDAVAKGASVVAGGPSTGLLMDATVLKGVTREMRIYAEESFGPVTTVTVARDADDAVRLANDSEYGLSAAVFSRDIAAALSVASRIHSGICHINGPTVHDEPQMPFGGVKASGYGRFGGKAAIAEFTDLRWITIETQPGRYPI